MLPLDGVKVLDLSQFLAGPYCTMVLSDLGAEVTKVEKFPQGDDSRRVGPFENGEGYCFAMGNRNKRSVALDLKSDKGKEIFLKLAEDADIIVENFRPGVVKRLGVDYETIKSFNKEVIYCSITGFGQDGPYSQKGGFDIIAQGMTGLMTMTGSPNGRPAKVGVAICDLAGGSTALYGILGAYIHKMRTGEGQYIDTSLVDSGLSWTIWEAAAYFGSGEVPEATGTRHRRSTPYQAYKTADGYATVGANNQRLWERFCHNVIERPEWIDDKRYKTFLDRMDNINTLEADIEKVLVQKPTEYWVEKLAEAGVPGGPVYTYDQALNDPHVRAREMVVEVDHPKIGKMNSLGIPVKYSKTPMSIRHAAPWLGQHTDDVLREAGMSAQEIDQMYEDNIVYNKYQKTGGKTQ